MALMGESCYFPPLDRCFSGERQLLSWKTAFTGLSQLGNASADGLLARHLTDPQTLNLLVRSFARFPAPTPQTKSSFETKTSAINVSPAINGEYDIKEIQNDTLWLSKETGIDEMAALRIAVLEWQMRSAVRLRGPGAFNTTEARQTRLLEMYLSERRYIIKTSEYVVFKATSRAGDIEMGISNGKAADRSDWVEELGSVILNAWNINGLSQGTGKNYLVIAVEALQTRIEGLEHGSGWFRDQGLRENIEAAWETNQLLELIHIMQTMLILLDSSTKLTRSDAFLSWFRLMSKCGFFGFFEPPYRTLPENFELPFQSLVALISLAVLKIPLALELLSQFSTAGPSAAASTDDAPYILNPAGVNETNGIIIEAATACSVTAGPTVLAWGIILQTLREYALISKESRELRQSQRAADRYGAADSSDNEGAERSSLGSGPSPQRRSSAGSDTSQQQSFLEELLDRIMLTPVDGDPIGYLAKSALDKSGVFNIISTLAVDYCTPFGSEHDGRYGLKVRCLLLDLIRAVSDWLDYQPALIKAALAVLNGSDRYWDNLERPMSSNGDEPATFFMYDDLLMQKIFRTALARFPYESLPFLKLCRALAVCTAGNGEGMPAIWPMIKEMDSITIMLPAGFVDYKTIREEEDANYVELISNLPFIGQSVGSSSLYSQNYRKNSRALTTFDQYSSAQELPKGTVGRVLSESKPPVVLWQYDFSALAYMGMVLKYSSTGDILPVENASAVESMDIASEVIGLITALLTSAARGASADEAPLTASEAARAVLEAASDGLDRNEDVVSIIFAIFESELHRRHNISEEEGSVDVLVRCIQFTHALLLVMPDRVWPFLGRSSLLGIVGGESQLSALIASTEMVMGRYDFLIGCIRVFDALVEDAMAHGIARRAPTKAIARFASTANIGTGISETAMKKVLLSFQRVMIDVFESTMNWKFIVQEERLEINTWLCTIFQKILNYSFAVGEDLSSSHKLAEPLAPAARQILDVFLSRSNNDLTIYPLLHIFLDGVATTNTSPSTRGFQYWTSQVVAAITLTTTLVRINVLLHNPPSRLEEQIFKAAPILAVVYVAHESFRLPTAELFEALISGAATTNQQPPSLLGHLSQDTASCFLEVLSAIDQPLRDDELSTSVWRLLSAVVSKRQQWLAIFVLTGNTPRDSLKDSTSRSPRIVPQHAKPILNIALDSLSNISTLQLQKALAMLEFVKLTADFWPWVLVSIELHPDFLTSISDYVALLDLPPASTQDRERNTPIGYGKLQVSSFILDILAMYVHHTQHIGDLSYSKKLLPKLKYFMKNAVSVPNYNASLHGRLRQNFESKFLTCNLVDFKRTALKRPLLGTTFYYDLSIADKMLHYDPAWTGRPDQGFAEELRRANLNLSLVESQVNLLHSWKFLAIELSRALGTEAKFQKLMVFIVKECLRSNAQNSLPEAIFERLALSRVELAFTLLQRLIEVKSPTEEVRSVLSVAWDTIRTYGTDLGFSLDGEGAEHYRMLLKILSLALQAHTSMAPSQHSEKPQSPDSNRTTIPPTSSAPPVAPNIVLEILGIIVAQGFRSLTTLLHDDRTRVHPGDFALITAILRTALRIPGIERSTTQLISQFADHQTARCASTLLSWSDQLATDRDPIYGELSILFLLELSSIPALAESLAVDGLLAYISNTNLIKYLRQAKGMGPFDSPLRLYSIWSRGILPLYLNLLHAIGAPIAAEVSAALNTFPSQLARASSTFNDKTSSASASGNLATAGLITLNMVSEAQTLAVLVTILDSFREAGASAGIVSADILQPLWDRNQVKEDLENWMQRRGTLRGKIVPINEKEEAWAREEPVKAESGAENQLEEKIVDGIRSILGLLEGGG